MPPQKSHPAIDLRLHLVAAVLEPAVTLARLGGLSLDELHELTTQAYFNELRDRGLSWNQIARRLGRSRTTVATLAKRLRSHAPTLDTDRFDLQRRVVALLAEGGAMKASEVARRLRKPRERVDEQLGILASDGVLVESAGKFAVSVEWVELTGEDVERRVSALRHFTQSVAQVLYQRFLAPGDDGCAFARTLTFRSPSARRTLTRAEATYRDVKRWVHDEDRDAESAEDSTELSVLFAIAERPHGHPWNPRG
jgi:biotin operon repressor